MMRTHLHEREALPRLPAITRGWMLPFVLPALLLAVFVLAYARSFPIWETWFFIPVWEHLRDHGPWLADLFVSRWGHISAFPSLIYLMLDRLFNYDQRADIWFIVASSVASLYLLLRFYLPRSTPMTRILLGVAFLSIRADEIWLDGWNMMMMVPLLIALAAGACVLRTDSWRGFAACAALTFLGLNSGGYCLPLLPAVLVVLLAKTHLRSGDARVRIKAQIAAWLFWSLLLGIYWHALRRGSAAGVLLTIFDPGFYRLLAQQLAFVFADGHLGALMLMTSVAVLGVALIAARKHFPAEFLTGLLFLIVYASVLALLIGTVRTLHDQVPVHSRYIPFLCLIPVALLAFAESVFRRAAEAGGVLAAWRPALCALICLLIAGVLYGEYAFYRTFKVSAPQMAALDDAYRHAPYTLTPGMFLHRAALDPGLVAQGLAIMKRHRLGPFAGATTDPASETRKPPDPARRDSANIQSGVDQVETDAGNTVVQGWAFDTATGASMRDVYAVTASGCTETALRNLPRPDVAGFFKSAAAGRAGWMMTLPAGCIPPHRRALTLYFLGGDGHWSSRELTP